MARHHVTGRTGVTVAACAFALILGWSLHGITDGPPEPQQVTRTEFTNKAGQDCTQVVTENAVAITCSYKPAETRLGQALEGLGQ